MIKILLFLSVVLVCCIHPKEVQRTIATETKIANDSNMYKVYKIDSVNSYYLVYAKRKDTIYKIVSKKDIMPQCNEIRLGMSYRLELGSIWKQKTVIGNSNVSPSVTLNVNCLSFDDSTRICLERDSINDLFYAENLKGLCPLRQ